MSWAKRRGAPRRAVAIARRYYVLVWRDRNRGGGEVGNLLLVFHFSSRPRRRSGGNVGISPVCGEIPKGLVERVGSLLLAFHSFHSPGISTALRWLGSHPWLPAVRQNQPSQHRGAAGIQRARAAAVPSSDQARLEHLLPARASDRRARSSGMIPIKNPRSCLGFPA
jgi:hypothetical protein